MKKADSLSILASFATLKALSDGKQYASAYQLLSEFISYIIYTEKVYSFSAVEMKNRLYNVFGFEIPEAVVKTATRSISFLAKENGIYFVKQDQFAPDRTLEFTRKEEHDNNSRIINELENFIFEKEPDRIIDYVQLTKDIVTFLVDDGSKSSGQYINLISEFILKKEKDSSAQDYFQKIKEGSILYLGITHNINETGSFKKQLTLYLDTEILFSLVGYNGEIYKTLALDFYSQVKTANLDGEKIKLTYFPEVETEIDVYFKSAASIVEGHAQATNKPAMAAIINGCVTAADVEVRKSDFYHKLGVSFGIHRDKKDNYYTKEDNLYNLESKEYTDPKDQESWKFISHINKLRKAQLYSNNTEAEYLFVTNTHNTIKISRAYTEKLKAEQGLECICDYALSLDRITNIIWYKLGNGFSKKPYPNNVSAILNARIVLASCIAFNVERVYLDAKAEFYSGKITEEQLAARITTLRKKPILPEEIEGDSIEDSMNFSPEYMQRFEEEVKNNKTLVREKEQMIQFLTEQKKSDLKKKDDIIAERDQVIEMQEREKIAMKAELDEYRQKDERKRQQIETIKRVFRFSWAIIWKALVIVGVTALGIYIEKKTNCNVFLYIAGIFDMVAVFYTIWSAIKRDYNKIFKS